MTALRTGSNRLRVDYDRAWGVPLEERICWCCGIGVEDEKHFLLHCHEYSELRQQLFEGLVLLLGGSVVRWSRMTLCQPDTMFNLLVGFGAKTKRIQIMACVETFLVRAMKKRKDFCVRAGTIPQSLESQRR